MKLVLLILTLLSSSASCGDEQKRANPNQNNPNSMKNVNTFVEKFSTFSMDIEAAGLANIPNATISENGELYTEYAYVSGSEKRAGKMTLQNKGNNRFEGNWKTDADNGNSYQGSLYFVFDEMGNAIGEYQFGGSDYKISIFKTKK